MLKKIIWIVIIILIAIQFFHPKKNQSAAKSKSDIITIYQAPLNIQNTLNKACYDCHSNNTHYPWYNNIQPVAWWLNNHINDGKRYLNFSEFASYSIARRYKRLDDCIEAVKKDNMPLPSYTWIHKNAILTDTEKKDFINWCTNICDSIKAKYSVDSLITSEERNSIPQRHDLN